MCPLPAGITNDSTIRDFKTPTEIICPAVIPPARCPPSPRNVEDLLHE
jgi:hypothetical protein